MQMPSDRYKKHGSTNNTAIMEKTYDREHMKPVIRASICTGEEVAGFKDIRTGKIEEIMLIRSPEDLEKFKEIYEITEEITKEY